MIVTDIKHIYHQLPMTAGLRRASDFLSRPDIHRFSDGKVEIDGENVFAIVQRYDTVETEVPKFESHKKYIDVQYILSGTETIAWAPAERMAVTDAYDEENDICFGTVPPGEWAALCLKAGQLAVLYPEDAHAPRIAPGSPLPVIKIVVKVAI